MEDYQVSLVTINPSAMFDKKSILDWRNRETDLSPSEQLYTARGSQSVATTAKLITDTSFNLKNFKNTLKLDDMGYGKHGTKYRMRVIWTAKTIPFFAKRSSNDRSLIYNIPSFLHMAELDLDELPWKKIYIRMHDPSDTLLLEEIIGALRAAVPHNVDVYSAQPEDSN